MNEDEELNVIAIFYDGWGQGKNLREALEHYKGGYTKVQVSKLVARGLARIYVTNALTGGKFIHATSIPCFIPPAGKWAISLGDEDGKAHALIR